jgi:hypothetical protein
MRYASSPCSILFVIFIYFVQCAAMQQEELEQKEQPIARTHTHRRAPNLCKQCFDRTLYVSCGAAIAAATTYIHRILEEKQYGCQKVIYEINPRRDTEFLIGNIACALCCASGAVYSLYEMCRFVMDLCKIMHKHGNHLCCFCRRLEHYLEYGEGPQQENPPPVDPAQPENSQQQV